MPWFMDAGKRHKLMMRMAARTPYASLHQVLEGLADKIYSKITNFIGGNTCLTKN